MNMAVERSKGGWKALWVWVNLAFAVLVGAWVLLIVVASDNAPEPVPLTSGKR